MRRQSRIARALCSALLALVIACGGSSGGGSGPTRTVRIILGHLRFAPAALTVKAGTKVHFILKNSDAIEHEFVLGSEAVQQEHEDMRMSGGHMMNNSGMGVADVPAGKTVDLSFTFSSPGTLVYGCHVDDHYPQGMKGTVTVTS